MVGGFALPDAVAKVIGAAMGQSSVNSLALEVYTTNPFYVARDVDLDLSADIETKTMSATASATVLGFSASYTFSTSPVQLPYSVDADLAVDLGVENPEFAGFGIVVGFKPGASTGYLDPSGACPGMGPGFGETTLIAISQWNDEI